MERDRSTSEQLELAEQVMHKIEERLELARQILNNAVAELRRRQVEQESERITRNERTGGTEGQQVEPETQ